jgi:predicted nucleotidyltransferase
VREAIAQYIEGVREHVRVDRVYLFGSCAKGTAGKWSDIDLAIISPDFGESLYRDVSVLARVESDPRLGLSPLPFSRREWEELPRGSFLREVIKTGEEMYRAPSAKEQ